MKILIKAIIFLLIIYFLASFGMKILKNEIFKKEFTEYVEQASDAYSVDDNLIYSIIKVESNFNPKVESKAGAKGLMQIMDETGKEISSKIGIDNFEPDMLFDPKTNILIGTKYFSILLEKYNGDTELALMAYNAGFGNVDKWLQEGKIVQNEDSAYVVPYKETQNYWQKVMTNWNIYHELYGENK